MKILITGSDLEVKKVWRLLSKHRGIAIEDVTHQVTDGQVNVGLEDENRQIKLQLESANSDITALQGEKDELISRIAELEAAKVTISIEGEASTGSTSESTIVIDQPEAPQETEAPKADKPKSGRKKSA